MLLYDSMMVDVYLNDVDYVIMYVVHHVKQNVFEWDDHGDQGNHAEREETIQQTCKNKHIRLSTSSYTSGQEEQYRFTFCILCIAHRHLSPFSLLSSLVYVVIATNIYLILFQHQC